MAWDDGEWDVDKERADQLAFLTGVKPGDGEGEYIGAVVDDQDDVMFGGSVVGQAITAMTRDAPEGRRLHSLHGYFLRPTSTRIPIDYRVSRIRDGRAYSSRHLTASQDGKAVFEALGSFTLDTEGWLYDLPHTSALPSLDDGERGFGMGGFEAVYLGATEQRDDKTYESTERKWFRMPAFEGFDADDVHLHTAYMGMVSDWTGTGSRPLAMEWEWQPGEGPPVASLDHAVWFHRAPNVAEWHHLDMHSLVNFGGRGQVRLTIRNQAGEVVASMAQELLLR
jgi:acyl-CoA thioesterase-2